VVKKWLFISENSEKSPNPNALDEWENEGGRIARLMK
jgi:hypothetical protein